MNTVPTVRRKKTQPASSSTGVTSFSLRFLPQNEQRRKQTFYHSGGDGRKYFFCIWNRTSCQWGCQQKKEKQGRKIDKKASQKKTRVVFLKEDGKSNMLQSKFNPTVNTNAEGVWKKIAEENQSEVFICDTKLGWILEKRKKKKGSCIIWIYLNKFHSCFLLNTVKKLSSDWSEWRYIYTAYSVLDVYWCCIPGLESNEISLDQVTLHQNSRVRSLSRPQPPCKRSSATIIAEPSVNILFMPVIKAGRGTSTCSTSCCGHIRFPWNYISPTHACSCGMQQRKKSNHKHKKYWRSEWCMRVKNVE